MVGSFLEKKASRKDAKKKHAKMQRRVGKASHAKSAKENLRIAHAPPRQLF
jgi:hypothetical protein